jgi:uncharacterized SAM-binding protein YcdF (DUF218 family)
VGNPVQRVIRIVGRVFAVVGAAAILSAAWLMCGWSTGLERLVAELDVPRPAQAIVCLTGGIADHALPTQEGWDRIYTAVQLQADGLAPTIVFSGGGSNRVSEAEVYAEAARWLGCPAAAIALDPLPASTAEHPRNLLRTKTIALRPASPLLIVTSSLHSKRAAMCFRKAGFSNFRMIASYEARRSPLARTSMRSALPAFKPSQRSYGDPLNRLRWGFDDTVSAVRELAAIALYRWRGQA